MLRSVTLLAALGTLVFAQKSITPHSAIEPPATTAASSLAASTKASPPDPLTTGEESNWSLTAPYAECVASDA